MRTLRYRLVTSIRFFKNDLWRTDTNKLSRGQRIFITPIKILYMTIATFINDNLISKASYLTYNTVLSIVPMFAVIVGIAKGFGLQNIIKNSLIGMMPHQSAELNRVFGYVDNYLLQVQGGWFIGIGFVVLLYTVLMLISSIEDTLNGVWQAPFSRSWSTRIFDYLGLFIILPVFITISSVINITSQALNSFVAGHSRIIAPFMNFVVGLVPVLLIIMLFVIIYMVLPNVRVKFLPALFAGFLAGVAFQVFQMIYISGMLWISKYNAIYGSFAAFPLLLLWLNLSWIITLFGAQLAYCIQNVKSYYFINSVNKISRRYKDFVALVIMSTITKRFMNINERPLNSEEISEICDIPLKLCNRVVNKMLRMGIIIEIKREDNQSETYLQPAVDPQVITVGYFLDRLDKAGSEDLPTDKDERFSKEWEAVLRSRHSGISISNDTLVRDL